MTNPIANVRAATPRLINIISENLYPQLRKASRSIWESCERNDFTIYDVKFYIDDTEDKIYLIVKTKKEPLSKTFIHKGPPVKLKKNAKEFIKKWKNNPRVTKKPYEKNGRLYVEIVREYTEITDFLKDQVKGLSMGRHLDKIVRKKYVTLELKDLLEENLRVFWTEYLDGKMPWER